MNFNDQHPFSIQDLQSIGWNLGKSLAQFYILNKQIQRQTALTNGWLKPYKLIQMTGTLAAEKIVKQIEAKQRLLKRQMFIKQYLARIGRVGGNNQSKKLLPNATIDLIQDVQTDQTHEHLKRSDTPQIINHLQGGINKDRRIFYSTFNNSMFHQSLDIDYRINEKKVASRGIDRSFQKRVSTPPTLLHQQIINSFDTKLHLSMDMNKQFSKRKQRQISINRFYKKLQYFQMQSQQRDNLKEQQMHQYDLMRTLKAWNTTTTTTTTTKTITENKDSKSFDKCKKNQQFQQWRKYFVQDQLQNAYDAIQKGNQPKQALNFVRNGKNQEQVDSVEVEEEDDQQESENESDSQPDCDNIPDIQLNLTTTIHYDDSPHNSSIYSQKLELNLELNPAQLSKDDDARSKVPIKLGVHIPNFGQMMSQFGQDKIEQRNSSRILQKVVTPIQQRIQDQSCLNSKPAQISPLLVGGAFTQTSPVEQYFSQTSDTPQNKIIAQCPNSSSFQRPAANHITDIKIRSNSNSIDANTIHRLQITNNKNIDLVKANNQIKQSRKSFFSDNQRIHGQDILLPPRYSAANKKSKQHRQQIIVKNQELNTTPAMQLGLSKINFPMAHQNIPSNSKIKFPVLRGVGQTMKNNDRNNEEVNNKNSYILLSDSQITNYKNNLREYSLIKAKRQQMKQNQSKNY